MTGIQIVLLTGIAFIGLYFIIRWKKRVVDILLLSAMISCSAVFILRPETTNTIARWLGVGRGADLVFYLGILIFWFVVLKLYARVRKLEQIVTEVIRKDAILNAESLSEISSSSTDLK